MKFGEPGESPSILVVDNAKTVADAMSRKIPVRDLHEFPCVACGESCFVPADSLAKCHRAVGRNLAFKCAACCGHDATCDDGEDRTCRPC